MDPTLKLMLTFFPLKVPKSAFSTLKVHSCGCCSDGCVSFEQVATRDGVQLPGLTRFVSLSYGVICLSLLFCEIIRSDLFSWHFSGIPKPDPLLPVSFLGTLH